MTAPDLDHFVLAQNARGTFARALEEIETGRKAGHWMWFVFPQVAGLGRSVTARTYALSGLEEASEYLAHPVLGPRLRQACTAILGNEDATAEQVLGPVDAMKLRSSMTLFARAAPDEPLFGEVLDRFFGGLADSAADEMLG